MRTASLLATAFGVGFLAACGQKGSLVLPDAQHPHKKLVVPKPAASPSAQPAASPGAAPPTTLGTSGTGNAGDANTAPAPQR